MLDTKCKLMVAALGAAFALPIAAQAQTNVTIYGKLYPDITHVNVTGATPAGSSVSSLSAAAKTTNDISATSMDSPNSRLGFKGSEDLGGGMSAIFQLEMGFSSDTGTLSTANTPFSRNTFVGLTGNFGTVKLGNMDTVYKELGDQMPFLGLTSGNFMSTSTVLSKPTFTNDSSSSFHLRRANSFYYTSPKLGGFTALADWSPNETVGDATSGVYSTGVKYENGPIYAALAYELHKDMFGGSMGTIGGVGSITGSSTAPVIPAGLSSKDSAVRGTFQYTFSDGWKAEVDVANLRYTESGQTAAGKFNTYKHNTWAVGVQKEMGAVTLVGSTGMEGAGSCTLTGGIACNTAGLNARMLNLGAGYSLSKRTLLFAVYTRLSNDSSAVTTSWLNGKAVDGQDQSIVAMGISHSF
ncbi:porin [Oxalobacteraceae bacterium CAVE-383]|nr:porin [Oxalobacteraceae bacterium CAVE-383]